MSGGPLPGARSSRPMYMRPIPTRRPLVVVLHDWIMRVALALLVILCLGYAYHAGYELWALLR